MRWTWVLFFTSALFAADERHLALLREAQAAFDKVEQAPSPLLADASACVQTQAGMLSVALPGEVSEISYRKGFCQLVVAAITGTPANFTDAATQLDHSGAAMLAWVARNAAHLPAPPAWSTNDSCPKSCQPLVPIGNQWFGWRALSQGDLAAASVKFEMGSGWYEYAAGRKAFDEAQYSEAATRYREALDIATRLQRTPQPTLAQRLAPPLDIPHLFTELGAAQLVSGDPKTAIITLDQAIQATPSSRAYFLRARAKELAGQFDPALADYNLASRTAFANATDLASGEGHLYRGILYFRRKDFERAEEEFASALNFEITPVLRPDAAAWRHLSAVASGFCAASKQYLEKSLPTVSPYFPKAEAKALVAGCPVGSPPEPQF